MGTTLVLEHGPPKDWGWFAAQDQQSMKFVAKSCPPCSHAADANIFESESQRHRKHPLGDSVTNFNRLSDLCTIGPEIQDMHGMLQASTSMLITERVRPVFGECKINLNNDILFPADMYESNGAQKTQVQRGNGASWDDKDDSIVWLPYADGAPSCSTEASASKPQCLGSGTTIASSPGVTSSQWTAGTTTCTAC